MSTHNICFRRGIRKLFTWYPLLSRPMTVFPRLNKFSVGLHLFNTVCCIPKIGHCLVYFLVYILTSDLLYTKMHTSIYCTFAQAITNLMHGYS